jgi:hypothetical protein
VGASLQCRECRDDGICFPKVAELDSQRRELSRSKVSEGAQECILLSKADDGRRG